MTNEVLITYLCYLTEGNASRRSENFHKSLESMSLLQDQKCKVVAIKNSCTKDAEQKIDSQDGIDFSIKLKKNLWDISVIYAAAKIAKEIYDYAKKNGFGSLDAPVSGGQAGAENGALTVMIGGDQADFDKAKDKIECYSKKMKLLGGPGNGQLAKMVNQICIAGLVQGLSEGINFGMKAGLNMEDVIEVISKGAAQSWQMENRYKTMINDKFDFGFAVDWMRKDLKIAMDEAKNNGSLLPVTELVDKYYSEVQDMGGNRLDTSSLIKRFRK